MADSSILVWRIPWTRVTKSRMDLVRNTGLFPSLLTQNLHFNRIPIHNWTSQVAPVVRNLPECRFINAEDRACSLPQSTGDGFDPWVRKIPWRRAWPPTPVFFTGESHGQRSLVGYSPQGRKELDMAEGTEHASGPLAFSTQQLSLELLLLFLPSLRFTHHTHLLNLALRP